MKTKVFGGVVNTLLFLFHSLLGAVSYGGDEASLCATLNSTGSNCFGRIRLELGSMGDRVQVLKQIPSAGINVADSSDQGYVMCLLRYERNLEELYTEPTHPTNGRPPAPKSGPVMNVKKDGIKLVVAITNGVIHHKTTNCWRIPIKSQNSTQTKYLSTWYYLEMGELNHPFEDAIKTVIEKHLVGFTDHAKKLLAEE